MTGSGSSPGKGFWSGSGGTGSLPEYRVVRSAAQVLAGALALVLAVDLALTEHPIPRSPLAVEPPWPPHGRREWEQW